MLLSHFFLNFCKISFFSSSDVFCNEKFKSQRKIYSEALENQGEIFIRVTYNSVKQPEKAENANVKSSLDDRSKRILMPTVLFHSDNSTHISIFMDSTLLTASYNRTTMSKDIPSTKTFWFHKSEELVKPTEIVLFQACRLFKTWSGINFEESILILSDGAYNETESYRRLSENLEKTIHYRYDEINDENFCICRHLEFYLNECQRNYRFEMIFVLAIFVAIVVVVKIQKKFVTFVISE
jgi:hypothetical protein